MRPRRCTLALCAVLALFASGCASPREDAPAREKQSKQSKQSKPASSSVVPETEPGDTPAEPWETLPVELLAGELIMTKLVGPTASAEELQAISRLQVGGIILFGPSVVDEPQLHALLQSLDRARSGAALRRGLHPRLIVSVDQEGGAIRNVPFAPPEQTQPSLAGGSVEQARESGRATGAALHELGISMDLGPVADLAAGPNRTMAGRAFGSDPSAVAPFVAATVEGLERGGVAAVAKHFPGFGASSANSDEAVAHVDSSAAQLRSTELVPFKAAIDADVDAVMVSHGIYRGLGSKLPATLEPKVATGLLRDELHFEGVAMTDSMNAKGFREAWGDTVPRACPVALAAGIDLLLLTGSMETARSCRERIIDAVADGSLPESRLREAARRVMELRRRVAPAAAS
jgi:beta-N-acetylhexosaminidase